MYLLGWLATLVIIISLGLAARHISKSLKKKDGNKEVGVFLSSEAVDCKDKLEREFGRLVSAIVWQHLKEDLKLRKTEKEVGCEEDVKNAFLKAVAEVDFANSNNSHSSSEAVLHRIKELIKQYGGH